MPQKAVKVTNPVTDAVCKYNTRYKEFPDYIKVTCFSRPIYNPDGFEAVKTKRQLEVEQERLLKKGQAQQWAKESVQELRSLGWIQPEEKFKGSINENGGFEINLVRPREEKEVRPDHVKRARDKAYEIANANHFDYFVTLTLDKNEVDRYSKEDVLPKFKDWLHNMAKRNEMIYLIFPEYHKDGAIHFHGLISGDLRMQDSGKFTQRGQTIYNVGRWTLGYTTAVKIGSKCTREQEVSSEEDEAAQMCEDYAKITNYIMKYVTKDNRRVFGKFYFAGGQGLKRELPTVYENRDYAAFEGTEYAIPSAWLSVKYATIPKVEDIP